jgi:tetratricopeptide (TPR) repeat protein
MFAIHAHAQVGGQELRDAVLRNDWPTVERVATATLKRTPNDRTASLMLTLAFLRQGKHDKALSAAERTIAIDSTLMQAYLMKAEAATNVRRGNDAIATLEDARRRFPDSIQPSWALGMAYARAGRCEEAVDPLEETMFRRPDVAGITQQLARCYFAIGRFPESAELYGRLVDRDPSNVVLRQSYGEALMAVGRFDSASTQFREVVRMRPDSADGYLALTAALIERREADEALNVARELARRRPDDAMAWYNVGLISLNAGKKDSASRAFKRAIAIRANYPEAHFNLAVALEGQGFHEDAVKSFKRAASMKPELAADAYNSIAILYRKEGRFEEALAMHDQAIALRDTSAVLHGARVNTYYEAQRCPDGLALVDATLARFPDHPEVLYVCARCLVRVGQLDRARAIAVRLDTLDPFLAEQVRLLMKL